MGGIQTIDVRLEPAFAGWRLDRALAAAVPTLSRERLKSLIRSGAVESAGKPVRDPATKVHGEEAFRLSVPEPSPAHNEAQDIPLTIIFEDEHLLVIDKPAGLVVHPGSGNWDGTLLNALLHHAPELAEIPRAGIVHRLDKDTSGLMVVAKQLSAHTSLVRQLQARSVTREYVALALGDIAISGTVDAAIGRHPAHRTKMAIVTSGKPARTHFAVVERFGVATLLRCRLETGRTHQIRVHLASLGHPLVGDPAYGRKGSIPFARQALHAARLALQHPVSGRQRSWESPLPQDLQRLIASLRGESAQ